MSFQTSTRILATLTVCLWVCTTVAVASAVAPARPMSAPFPPDENFDEAPLPHFPIYWATLHAGTGGTWVTTDSNPDSAPNAAFSSTPGSTSDNSLITPTFYVVFRAELSFNQTYAFEPNFDGAVLEIAIGDTDIYDGRFTDIVAAGGSFPAGGYNATIATGYDNPLAGRPAWSGPYAGYQAVIVHLPDQAQDRNVQLRWRVGTDRSGGGQGYWIDDVHVAFDNADFVYVDGFDRRGTPYRVADRQR
jgi:hypothetical protein